MIAEAWKQVWAIIVACRSNRKIGAKTLFPYLENYRYNQLFYVFICQLIMIINIIIISGWMSSVKTLFLLNPYSFALKVFVLRDWY